MKGSGYKGELNRVFVRGLMRDARDAELPGFAAGLVAAVAATLAGVLVATADGYGFHRDELYFLAAGQRPAFGYVDQPPMTPLVARASVALFGATPAGLRVASTLAGVLTVVAIAMVCRELGGGRVAQALAGACLAVSGFSLVVFHMVSTATFDLLGWVVVAWLVLRVLRTGDGRWWLAVGAAIGMALMNKHLVLLLVASLGVALLVVGPRRVLKSGWLFAGIGLALVVTSPNLVWQATHGWPQLTVASGISAQDGAENRMLFVPLQLVYLSLLFVPVWAAGLWRLWRDPHLRWARSFALAYPVLCVMVVLLGAKPYYTVPLLAVLMAAGCPPLVRWLSRGRTAVRRAVAAAALVSTASASAVIALPLLPPEQLGLILALNRESGEQVGWPRLVEAVVEGWQRIPAEQRARAVIFTSNYGQAGAVEWYGPALGLPRPYSGHMSYADWGPPPDWADGPVLLVVQQGDAEPSAFTGCREVRRVDNGEGVNNEEQGARILLCDRHARWAKLWPALRRYY